MSEYTQLKVDEELSPLNEAIKTFVTLAVLIFLLISCFCVLVLIFPYQNDGSKVVWNPDGFIFGYIMAIPFMFGLSLYPFGKK